MSAAQLGAGQKTSPLPNVASNIYQTPVVPQTPPAAIISPFSSPTLNYRTEEEAVVFELGTRHLSTGVAGESSPRCIIPFGPDFSRRAGDYRQWIPDCSPRPRLKRRQNEFEDSHELWRMDLRGFDVGSVEDKIERAVRLAYERYLLLDPKSRKAILVVPAIIPHPLLHVVLETLFRHFSIPHITLVATPTASIIASGCRSGLHVDIGWVETTVTAVYEYRLVRAMSTVRAMRSLAQAMKDLLDSSKVGQQSKPSTVESEAPSTQADATLPEVEEVIKRMLWCPLTPRKVMANEASEPGLPNPLTIPDGQIPRQMRNISIDKLHDVLEHTFLSYGKTEDVDDHESSIPTLIYDCLRHVASDVRAQCLSRIVFTGGGSHIPGLRSRILHDLRCHIERHGWTKTRMRKRAEDLLPADKNIVIDASSGQRQLQDYIDEKLWKKSTESHAAGSAVQPRCVESLGSWAGASLMSTLRVQGTAELDREAFLQHGLPLSRAEIDRESVKGQIPELSRFSMADRTSWSLGAWA